MLLRLFLLCAALVCLPFTTAVNTYTNPLKTTDGSDPFMVYDGGYYYLTTTTWTNIQITRATTISGLKTATPKVVWTDSTASRCCNVWAPEIHKVGSTWYIYYVAGVSTDIDSQHIHVLEGGSTPYDTYSFKATVIGDIWAIDPTLVTISGTNYLVYSATSPAGLQSLYISPMSNAYTAGSRYLISEPTLAWETVGSPVNEGPAALYNGSSIWLTYSASYCWTSSYSLGQLTWTGGTPTLESSWTKYTAGPVFSSANGDYGTAHNGFFTSPDGTKTYIVYHASLTSTVACDGTRETFAQAIGWHSNGSPLLGSPRAITDSIPVPPGE